jgi:hypothetical protein
MGPNNILSPGYDKARLSLKHRQSYLLQPRCFTRLTSSILDFFAVSVDLLDVLSLERMVYYMGSQCV